VSRSVKFDRTGSEHGFRARAVAEAPGAAGCRDTLPRVSAACPGPLSRGITLLPQKARFLNHGPAPLGIPGPVALRGPHKPQGVMAQASATRKHAQKQQGHRGPVANSRWDRQGAERGNRTPVARFVRVFSRSSQFRGTGKGNICLRPARCRCPRPYLGQTTVVLRSVATPQERKRQPARSAS
jgi:hypothetical protein